MVDLYWFTFFRSASGSRLQTLKKQQPKFTSNQVANNHKPHQALAQSPQKTRRVKVAAVPYVKYAHWYGQRSIHCSGEHCLKGLFILS